MRRAALGALFLLLETSAARANGPEIGFDAGTIFPIESRNIQLVSETVTIDLPAEAYSNASKVKHNAVCKYVLRNLSDSTLTFHMAFVSNTRYEAADTLDIVSNSYEVTQDGRNCEVSYYRSRENEFFSEFGSNQVLFPTWALSLGPHATSVVEILYNASWTGGCDGEGCGYSFTYHAPPAALWAGRIEHADFQLRIPDKTFLRNFQRREAPWNAHVSPPGCRWSTDGLGWSFENWEPDTDLQMWVNYPAYDLGGDPAWDPWTPDSVAALPPVTSGLDREPRKDKGLTCIDPRPGYGNHPAGGWPAASIRLRVRVNERGEVDHVRYPDPPSTNTMNDTPEQCVRHWHFQPATKGGRAVPAWTDVTIRFPAIP